MTQEFHSWVYIQKNPKTLIQNDTCTPMFIAVLFANAKIWKRPKWPSTDEWVKKMWYIYIYIQWNTTVKRNKFLPFAATWVDLEVITLSEISQMEKDKYCMISLTCGI